MRVYIYKGQRVFLEYEEDMPGVKPIQTSAGVGCYPVDAYNGTDTCSANDDAGLLDPEVEYEIVDTECVSLGNDQKLSLGWWTKDYAEYDLVNRQLCVGTDRYYDWTSELTRFLRAMCKELEEHPDWFNEAEWQKDWDKICEEYTSKVSDDNLCDMPDIPTVKDMLTWI